MKKTLIILASFVSLSAAYADGKIHCVINKSLSPCGETTLALPDQYGGIENAMDFSSCPNVGLSITRATGASDIDVTLGYINPKEKPTFATDQNSTVEFTDEVPKHFKVIYGSEQKDGLFSKIGVFLEADCTQE